MTKFNYSQSYPQYPQEDNVNKIFRDVNLKVNITKIRLHNNVLHKRDLDNRI